MLVLIKAVKVLWFWNLSCILLFLWYSWIINFKTKACKFTLFSAEFCRLCSMVTVMESPSSSSYRIVISPPQNKFPWVPFVVSSSPTSSPQVTADLFSVPTGFSGMFCKWNYKVAFWIWLSSAGMMHLRFIHIVECVRGSFFHTDE